MTSTRLLLIVFIVAAWGCGTRKPATHSSTQSIEEKYAQLLGVSQSSITNKSLYAFIEDWYGVPYKYGGKTKSGVDCSGFTSILFKEIYGKEVGGSSANIYTQCKPISTGELKEGDLVFFKIETKDVSHVGIYLQNNKFVHATTKAGVMINDLNEDYYRRYFSGSGRLN